MRKDPRFSVPKSELMRPSIVSPTASHIFFALSRSRLLAVVSLLALRARASCWAKIRSSPGVRG